MKTIETMTKEEREQYEKDMAKIQKNGLALQYVKNQTAEICMVAVKQTGYALEHVENQTPEICMAAVQKYGWALQFVKNIPALKQYIFQQMNPKDAKRFSLFADNGINSSDHEKLKIILDRMERLS